MPLKNLLELSEPLEFYGKKDLLYKGEVYKIISCCMEVHRELGRGFLEAVYQEALEHEFQLRKIPFEKEKNFRIEYKNQTLKKFYISDFVVYDKILLEIKAQAGIIEKDFRQTINYLAVTKLKLGLLVNFGEDQLKFKKIVL
jgi:GxxExxY protein